MYYSIPGITVVPAEAYRLVACADSWKINMQCHLHTVLLQQVGMVSMLVVTLIKEIYKSGPTARPYGIPAFSVTGDESEFQPWKGCWGTGEEKSQISCRDWRLRWLW